VERVEKSGTLTSFITLFLQEYKMIKQYKSIKIADFLMVWSDFMVA